MDTTKAQPFCPDCKAPLNSPEPVLAPVSNFFAFGHIQAECDRNCPNCNSLVRWSSTGPSEGAWVAVPVAPDRDQPAPDRDQNGHLRSVSEDAAATGAEASPSTAELVPLGPRSAVVVMPPRPKPKKQVKSRVKKSSSAGERGRPRPSETPAPTADDLAAQFGMRERVISIAEVARSSPWTEAALLELAETAGSPFRKKAGIWVTRESAFLQWIDSDPDTPERPFKAPSRRRAQAGRRGGSAAQHQNGGSAAARQG